MEDHLDEPSGKANGRILEFIESLNTNKDKLSPTQYFFAGMEFVTNGWNLDHKDSFIDKLVRYNDLTEQMGLSLSEQIALFTSEILNRDHHTKKGTNFRKRMHEEVSAFDDLFPDIKERKTAKFSNSHKKQKV
jgi:hypothetical protein